VYVVITEHFIKEKN